MRTLDIAGKTVSYYPLDEAADATQLARLPFVVRVFLENVLRHQGAGASPEHIALLLDRSGNAKGEFPFFPARVILQDFTGVPCVADLAAMRSAVARLGGQARAVNPKIPVDLVIDHSVIVDAFGSQSAFARNVELEYERNRERYAFLRWAQGAFDHFSVVPPGAGIVHQVNLEYLARVVHSRTIDGTTVVYPDTLLGTDSHTTMIGGLGVLGWGVGGIEAEAGVLAEPTGMLPPVVVGVRLHGELPEGVTATDLVLAITELLRNHGVVGKFVEFHGPGLASLTVADRATISNMSPEYGATEGIFPVDDQTLVYLRNSGRSEEQIELVEAYCRAQGLFHTAESPEPDYDEHLTFDLRSLVPSMAGPSRPQDRVALPDVGERFRGELERFRGNPAGGIRRKGADVELLHTPVQMNGTPSDLADGSVVIAAITSCTNTSNPSVMVGAGLLARNAVAKGLKVAPTVKTSLAPGSPVVIDYLTNAGLMEPLEALGFNLVGFGCTTCIAEGTPVLLGSGVSIPIERMPAAGGAKVFGPAPDGGIAVSEQRELMEQGERECVTLTLQDGRTLTCTPDHRILTLAGRWVRADELRVGVDRVVAGLEGVVDVVGDDEAGWVLEAGAMRFTMDAVGRARTLAFSRLLGHLLDDGSISTHGQARINVGQAVDREAVLDDIELVTGKRPAGTRYDERKWSIVLPAELARAIIELDGVRVGRRINQTPQLPAFVLDEACPIAVVREFLGGAFGADGAAPTLSRYGSADDDRSLSHPAYSHAVKPHHVADQRAVMEQLLCLLARVGVRTDGATISEYPVRFADSSYPAARDGEPRIELRLQLTDGLSFVTEVGFRYAVDKSLRAAAAAVYWRTIAAIERQRLWMAERLRALHAEQPKLSFQAGRRIAASELAAQEPVLFPHYSTLAGCDRFSRLPHRGMPRGFRPLHREACGFPSPVEVLTSIGAREWFPGAAPEGVGSSGRRFAVGKESLALPAMRLGILERRQAGTRLVYDISVEQLHAFIAGGVAVHNCIGNSGPLPDPIAAAIDEHKLTTAAVLSGNRNFEGRVHSQVKASFLASPPLVVAYALAGTVDIDLTTQPLGTGSDGEPVYLRDIWPSSTEVASTVAASMSRDSYVQRYSEIFSGDERWNDLDVPTGDLYEWDANSTYIAEPPFVQDTQPDATPPADITGARALVLVGDSITTDHISPAGQIAAASPAGQWLQERGVDKAHLHSYGARRGNHEIMVRGTFANLRLRNQLAADADGNVKEGGHTTYLPTGEITTVFEAAERYRADGTPLVIFAGREYGTGSSRDWAAKGTQLLGVRVVLAASYERIHRANLVQMGVLPLQLSDTPEALGITGREEVTIAGLASVGVGDMVSVILKDANGERTIEALARLDTQADVRYFREGGILPAVVRELAKTREE